MNNQLSILLMKLELLKGWKLIGVIHGIASGLKLQASSLITVGKSILRITMKDFKKLKIWQQGMNIVDKIYDVIPHLPAEEKFGLRAQLTRSAISIPSNIAEGSAKRSQKDYLRFVEMSLGSSFELETHLLTVRRRNWMDEKLLDDLLSMISVEQRMISKFIDKL